MSQSLDAGGSERQLTEIAKSLDRSRFEPHVACFRDGGIRFGELRKAGVPVVVLPIASFRSPAALRAIAILRRYARANKIQLLHAFDTPTALWGVPAGRLLRLPVVLSSQRVFRSLRGPLSRRLMRVTDRMADGIVVNSQAVRESLIAEDAVPPGRIHLCYNGIDIERFHSQREPPVAESPVVIVFTGVLRQEKGLDTLLSAVQRLGLSERELRVHLIGWGPMKESLKQQSRDLKLDGICSFDLPTEHVEEALRKADIFVLASRSESFSNALMEAMSCGCAVVASRVGGNPELVEDGQSGLLFDAGDSSDLAAKLRLLIEDRPFRERLGCKAAERIRGRFGLADATASMGRIYESFLADAARR